MIRIPHLETDITQACQLSCVACNHSVPLWRTRKGGPWFANRKQMESDLEHLTHFLHADRWGALGGEPLLHPHLIDLLQVAVDSGIANQYEVWTNGLRVPQMPRAFWECLDILVLSVYPGKHTVDSLDWIRNKCADEGVILELKDEVRRPNFKTMLEKVPTHPIATQAKFAGCFFRSFSRSASYGYFFTCCCGPHIPMLLQDQPYGTDGVLIADSTEESIHAYLNQVTPLGACTICAGRDTAVDIHWSEEPRAMEWIAKSSGLSV